jgi:hypothetical protein
MTKKPKTSPPRSLHEPMTADTGTISLSLVGLGITIVASLIIVALLIWFLSSDNRNVAAENSSSTAQDRSAAASAVPAGVPALDPHQADELAELRARDRQILSTYAWLDRQAGIARIPIDRAMQILAQRAEGSENAPKHEGSHE